MKKIFIGMLFVFLNLPINIGSFRINLIPDFIGYIFIAIGTKELDEYSRRFLKVMPYSICMLIYTAVFYIVDLFEIFITLGIPVWVALVLDIISKIASILIYRGIILGIKDIEVAQEQDLNSKKLYGTLRLYAILSLLIYILYLFPGMETSGAIVYFAVGIYLLVLFNKSKKQFYAWTAHKRAE